MNYRSAIIFIIAITAQVGLAGAGDAPNCHALVKSFLQKPSEQKRALLSDERRSSNCWQLIGSSDQDLDKLIGIVQMGSVPAAELLAKNLSPLDGGALEDALVAISLFGDIEPQRYLNLAANGIMSFRNLKSSAEMLPLSMSDDLDRQLTTLRARRRRIASVGNPRLIAEKSAALASIDDALKEVLTHKIGR